MFQAEQHNIQPRWPPALDRVKRQLPHTSSADSVRIVSHSRSFESVYLVTPNLRSGTNLLVKMRLWNKMRCVEVLKMRCVEVQVEVLELLDVS